MLSDKQYNKVQKAKDVLQVNKAKLGKAGEYFVAGKLLLNGFNVFNGAIDDGIDLVAKKRKKFYYIQVKTCQDLGYDTGKYMATINLATFSKFPEKQTFLVLVMHFLGPTSSSDFMGDHNVYEQMFVVLPAIKIKEIFGKTSGKTTFYIFNSLVAEQPTDGWIVKLRYQKKM